jgi:hypothetical protein
MVDRFRNVYAVCALIEKMRWQPVRRGNGAPYYEGSILKPAIGSIEKSRQVPSHLIA